MTVRAFYGVAAAERGFYARRSYGDRITDNVSHWLGLPHLTMFDVVLVATLLPAMVILISWWLPWEKWLFQRPARIIGGPYFLYCTVVLWHLQAPRWAVTGVAILGGILCGAIRERLQPWRRE